MKRYNLLAKISIIASNSFLLQVDIAQIRIVNNKANDLT